MLRTRAAGAARLPPPPKKKNYYTNPVLGSGGGGKLAFSVLKIPQILYIHNSSILATPAASCTNPCPIPSNMHMESYSIQISIFLPDPFTKTLAVSKEAVNAKSTGALNNRDIFFPTQPKLSVRIRSESHPLHPDRYGTIRNFGAIIRYGP